MPLPGSQFSTAEYNEISKHTWNESINRHKHPLSDITKENTGQNPEHLYFLPYNKRAWHINHPHFSHRWGRQTPSSTKPEHSQHIWTPFTDKQRRGSTKECLLGHSSLFAVNFRAAMGRLCCLHIPGAAWYPASSPRRMSNLFLQISGDKNHAWHLAHFLLPTQFAKNLELCFPRHIYRAVLFVLLAATNDNNAPLFSV